MTIEIHGHVEKMEVGTSNVVKVTICPSMARMHGRTITIELTRDEAKHYMPGSGVIIQIRPHGEVGPAFPTSGDAP